MVFYILDSREVLVHEGRNWTFTRAYLDYLVRTSDSPFKLVVRPDR